MARIGYARVSSTTQNLDRQVEALKDTDKLFIDKMSGKSSNRPQLNEMLEYIREGDVVVITELDRLGRNNKDLTDIMDEIQKKGATLEIMNLPTLKGIEDENLRRLINTLIIEIYKYQAESERQWTRERQKQGITIAKEKGRYKGGKLKYSYDDPKLQHAFNLYLNGETERHIEQVTGINRRTFRRYRELYNVYRNNEKER